MPPASKALPPCIVLGMETQIGLGIARELGRAGVPVLGIGHEPHPIGLASRYLVRALVIQPPRSRELIAAIHALGEEFGPCCLLTVSEANLAWLAQNALAFGKVRPLVPTAEKLALVLDKQQTLQAAQAVGIEVPQTLEISSLAHANALAQSLAFPVVLKWKDPNAVAEKLSAHGLELLKAEYVYTGAALVAVAERYQALGTWPLVQAYCPGQGLGQFFYMQGGRAIRRFQHLRIAEWPPEGGFSSVCDAVPLEQHQDLQEKSMALLRHLGWEGVAMVEYRWDPVTDKAVLMEVNGRYWGSFPLAVHCHAGFALLSYSLGSGLGLSAFPELPALADGFAAPPALSAQPGISALRPAIRCRMVSTEVKRLVRIYFHPELIVDRSFKVNRWRETVRFVADFFKPNVRYYVWDSSDPKPYFVDLMNLFRKLLGQR